MRIGILGATGPAGSGLGRAARECRARGAVRLARGREGRAARSPSSARSGATGSRNLHPCDNAWACDAPVVILAVHADSAIPTVQEHAERLQDKIVVSMANNLVKNGNEFNAVLPPHGSVAAEIQALLWRSHVCTAFHLVPAAEFADARPRHGERRRGARRQDDAKATRDGDHREHPRTCVRSTAGRCATRSAWRRSPRCC